MSDFDVTTHVKCAQADLLAVWRRYGRLLQQLGDADSAEAIHWFSELSWKTNGDGLASTGARMRLQEPKLAGRPVYVYPYALGYGNQDQPPIELEWVEIGLTFEESDSLEIHDSQQRWRFIPGLGHLVWDLLTRFFASFAESGVYFSASPLINEPWRALTNKALTNNKSDLWEFEAALIPLTLSSAFQPIKKGYPSVEYPGALGLARQSSWTVLPWEESMK